MPLVFRSVQDIAPFVVQVTYKPHISQRKTSKPTEFFGFQNHWTTKLMSHNLTLKRGREGEYHKHDLIFWLGIVLNCRGISPGNHHDFTIPTVRKNLHSYSLIPCFNLWKCLPLPKKSRKTHLCREDITSNPHGPRQGWLFLPLLFIDLNINFEPHHPSLMVSLSQKWVPNFSFGEFHDGRCISQTLSMYGVSTYIYPLNYQML